MPDNMLHTICDNKYKALETETHIYFYKNKTPFSQWYKKTFIGIIYEQGMKMDLVFCCQEQYHMARKADIFQDLDAFNKIMASLKPSEHLQYGREVKGFTEEEWLLHRNEILFTGNYLKFSQNEDLKEILLSTGNKILVEASPTDLIYGVGLAIDDPLILDSKNWRGENLLGKILMLVRDTMKAEQKYSCNINFQ